MAPDKLKLIIFDLDDTLAPAESNYDLAMQEIGIAPTDPTFLKARQMVKSNLPKLAPIARSRFLYLKTYLELQGQYTSKKALDLAEAYENKVIQKMTADWNQLKRPELFQKLKSKGYHLSVLSNESCRMQTRKLAQFEGNNHFFESLLTSEERGMEKPEPSLFREMLNYFKAEPKQALMIGDSYENDIEPCVQLGIPCLHTVEFKQPKKVFEKNIQNLDQLLDLI